MKKLLALGCLGWLVIVALTNCGNNMGTVNPIVTADTVVQRIDQILVKDVADSSDAAFIASLSQDELDLIFAHLGTDTTQVNTDSIDYLKAMPLAWAGEVIECGYGSGGTSSGGWFHTPLCGGDGGDHFFFYDNVDRAYQDRGRIRGRSTNPAILLVLASYQYQLSSRIYDSNDVFLCVGSRIHWWGGPTEETWRTRFHLFRS